MGIGCAQTAVLQHDFDLAGSVVVPSKIYDWVAELNDMANPG
jgi:hypothetical protein